MDESGYEHRIISLHYYLLRSGQGAGVYSE